ncbi:hypothetical protein [Pseudobacteroides cellulosolvens]|uniref:hypothetical protein n=1 Tax=Pseudobacteroides cellulosolvens TaxID=35825 RepID=UPI0012B57227|nr:hypothetical protein [Pseudobacteroides cellulosolvens]
MRGFCIGLPESMAAQPISFGWCFPSCIFSRSVDIAAFAASGFSAKACIFYRLFQ